MKICVFCSAQNIDEKYSKPALDAVEIFTQAGHDLVWGGSDTGLMKQVADTAQNNGAKIYGVSVEFLKHKARENADEMTIAADLPARKNLMLEKADAVLVLPGGLGTLDEIFEMLELKKHSIHEKPIVFLNTNGFYDGMYTQLKRMKNDGFIVRELDELVDFVNGPKEVISYLIK